MMNSLDKSSAVACGSCGEVFALPEDDTEGNLPRVLLCGHIYCTTCLQSIQCDGAIRCPECDPSDIEKIEQVVDEALAQAAENLAQLEHIREALTIGLERQVKRERARLVMEIKQAADKALHAINNWKEKQLNELTKLEAQFSSSQAEICHVNERIKALENAMHIARVWHVPFLERYCTLDNVLKTLQSPVDNQSFDMTCFTVRSGMSCVFQSEAFDQSLVLSLKMEVSSPKRLSESPPKGCQPGSSNRKSPLNMAAGRMKNHISPSQRKLPSPQKKDQDCQEVGSHSLHGPLPCQKPRDRSKLSRHSSGSDISTPDVIVEELIYVGEEPASLPPISHELASERRRFSRRRKNSSFGSERNVNQWVVVTHVVNPNHFYIRYVTEKKESEILSKKINHICRGDRCQFTLSDKVETGSMIFVKWKEGRWLRATVVEILQGGCADPVKACTVSQLTGIKAFCLDIGFTKSVTIQSEEMISESSLQAVNKHLRKVVMAVKAELSPFSPQAIRCSLKDLVPHDLTKGWGKMAQDGFLGVVGTSVVELKLLGQDRESLLVDLWKVPVDHASDVPISIREYLVFIEVARFYYPVTLSRRPLLYYPPVYPNPDTELDAVVTHINNPADFYIQLVDNMESLLLSCKLQNCYGTASEAGQDDLNIYCPAIGQACVARYDDQMWYRAQVVGHPGGRQVEVLFVDIGNIKIISVSELRKIKDEFFALPSMAIHCCLSDVIPLDGKTWSDTSTDRFISLAHHKLVAIFATDTVGGVDTSKPVPVQLYNCSESERTNIAELLVRDNLASFRDSLKSKQTGYPGDDCATWDPPLEACSSTGFIDSSDRPEQGEEPLDFQPQLKFPAQLKDLRVRVSHVISPSSFYVHLTQNDAQLKRLRELVKQECELTEPQDVVWKADMYCAAHINRAWERGQICSDVTTSDIAEVKRCDHGNVVKVHISNLRPLPSSLIGSLALECTLTDIRPAGGQSTWTATACDLISFYLTGVSAVMTIKELTDERPVPVTLFCSNEKGQFVSVADFLTSKGLALRERKPRDTDVEKPKLTETDAQTPLSKTQTQGSDDEQKNSLHHPGAAAVTFQSPLTSIPIPPKPVPRSLVSAEIVKTKLYDPPELPCLGHIKIIVSAVGEDGLIYIRTQNAESQLVQLREQIQQCMKTLPHQKPYTWKSVQGCAVIGPDMLWYRGQLQEVLRGHVKVQYLDYGLVESIPVVHVYPKLLCEDVPQLCMPCQLHGVNPVGGVWQQDAVAMLKEMLLNRCVDMNVLKLPSDPRKPLTVELFLDGLSLSRILCHHEHASMDRDGLAEKGDTVMSPALILDDWDLDTEGLKGPEETVLGPYSCPSLPQKGEQVQVRVNHVWTPIVLFLSPLEGTTAEKVDEESLDEALSRITADITSLPCLTNFPFGCPCLAEYNDGKYYRAKVMDITSIEPVMILVQHVDFGSDDTLPPSRLRQMPPELLRFPPQGLKVKVAGIKAPRRNAEENILLPYCPEWTVTAVLDTVDLLQNNIITASVVTQEPELTVMLYNKDGVMVHLPLVYRGLAELE